MNQFPSPASPKRGIANKNASNRNPLTSVRLPPPTMNEAYTWSINAQAQLQHSFRENTNMLRTPDSILKNHDVNLKRGADFEDSHVKLKLACTENTAPKSSGMGTSNESGPSVKASVCMPDQGNASSPSAGLVLRNDNSYVQRDPRHFEMPPTQMKNSGQWSAYFENAFPGFEFNNHTGVANEQNQSNSKQPSQLLRNQLINASPQNSKLAAYTASNPAFLNTPAKQECPSPMASTGVTQYRSFTDSQYVDMVQKSGKAGRNYNNFQPSLQLSRMPMQFMNNSCNITRPISSPATYVNIPSPENMPPIEDDGKKPSYSYAMLIGMAILRAPGRKLTLAQIYQWIVDSFEYYRNSKPAWHNSIRHNLSLNKAFEKRVRPKEDPGKGSYWTIVEGFEYQFLKARPQKKGSDFIEGHAGLERVTANNRHSYEPRTFDYESKDAHRVQKTKINESQCLSQSNIRPQSVTIPVETATSNQSLTLISDLDPKYSHDVIPSDGTEPDERFLEEEERLSQELQLKEYSKSGSSNKQQINETSSKRSPLKYPESVNIQQVLKRGVSGGTLPQMHTMTAQCSQSPKDDTNEWLGQGQLAFRCSTPSMLPQFQDSFENNGVQRSISSQLHQMNQLYDLVPGGVSGNSHKKSTNNYSENNVLKAPLPIPETPNSSKLSSVPSVRDSQISKYKVSSTSSGKTELKSESTDFVKRTSKNNTNTQSTSDNAEIVSASPKTPEKGSSTLANLSSGKPRFQNLVPSLLQRKSLESPYAGTLDYSPGIALTDFSDLDIQRSSGSIDTSCVHKRTDSNSSNDSQASQGSLSNSQGNLQVPGSLSSSFAVSLDLDLSLHNIMTPLRRPFDTPIRDQTHTYSPYTRTANSIGSPIKKQ